MKTIKDFDFKNKRVLVRCDFNAPLSDKGEVLDDFRIKQTIPTIEYLVGKGARVILMSHLDDPDGKVVESLRLSPVQDKLIEYLDLSVTKAPDCVGGELEYWTKQMKPGEVLLLENLRFHKEEEENGDEFAKALAGLGDIYINDAFGACHRKHASIVGVPKYLPSLAGFLLEKEIKVLSELVGNPSRPLVSIIGGVKISTKIKVINKFLEIADHVLLGSKIAESIFIANGVLLDRKFPEKEVFEEVKKINITNPKLHMPTDGIMGLPGDEKYSRIGGVGTVRKEEAIYDIGPETVKIFSGIIKTAKTIVWNGPLGLSEKKPFDTGTRDVVDAICRNHSALKIAGGGETDSYLHDNGIRERFDHVSTGGGAMLELLSGKELPGIAALK